MKLSDVASNIAANVICKRLDGGQIEIYGGTQPGRPEEEVVTKCLARLSFSPKSFKDAVKGVSRANAIGEGTVEVAGKATWFRAVSAKGDPVFDGSVGVSKFSDITLSETDLKIGDTLKIDMFEFVFKPS